MRCCDGGSQRFHEGKTRDRIRGLGVWRDQNTVRKTDPTDPSAFLLGRGSYRRFFGIELLLLVRIMRSGESISIWFFIGISLLVNGLLIVAAGLYEWGHPPQNPVVLFHVHASIWWGGFLLLVGTLHCFRFAPWKQRL
jgi:hypothetical protein